MRIYRALVLRGWWLILLLLFAAAFLFGRHAVRLDVNTSTRVLLNDDDEDLAYYESTRPVWGYDEYAIFCVTQSEWIAEDGVERLRAIVRDLEAVPHVTSVTSILDVPLLRQKGRSLMNPTSVGEAGVDFDAARVELLDHEIAVGYLISENGRDLGLHVHFDVPEEAQRLDARWSELQALPDPDPETRVETRRVESLWEASVARQRVRREAMVAGVRAVAAAWNERLEEPVRLSGTPIIRKNIEEHLNHDLRVFGIACLVLFVLAFLAFYRSTRFVVLPILTCLLPVLYVTGAMAWLGMKVTVTTANLPLLLFVLMLPYTVYFIERYRERRRHRPDEDGATSTFEAARAIFVPCLFSCLTTMAGFAALTTSRTRPIRDFGLMMAIGMGVGLLTVFLALPAMSRPLPPPRVRAGGVKRPARGLVRLFEGLALGRPVLVLVGAAVLLALSVAGALRLSAESKFTEYFWPKSEVYRGLEYIDTRLGGTTTLEIILRAEEAGHFLEPEGLDALEAAARYFDDVPETGSVASLATLVAELEKKAPAARKQLPFLARLKPMQAAMSEFVTDDQRVSRVFVRMRETAPTLDRNRILTGLREHLSTQPELQGLEVRETGIFLLYANMLNSLIDSQTKTFLLVIVAVFLMLVVLFRSFVLALLVLLPQVLPAVTVLGALGWLGIPLDLVTVMIASIALGVGIDAAIQYTVRFRRELEACGDPREALRRAHGTVGRAIWIATTVIVIGFCVLLLSDFRPSVWFGLFTAIAMLMSQVSALTVLPAIFLVTGRPRAPSPSSETTAP